MSIELIIKNEAELKKLSESWECDIKDGIEKGMQAIGMHLTNTIKKDITKTSQGSKNAIRYSPFRNVKVSPPGESPNNDTGELRSSIQWELTGRDSVIVGSVIKKGAWLEHGTKNMKPRPFIRPNAERETQKMGELLMAQIRKSMGGR